MKPEAWSGKCVERSSQGSGRKRGKGSVHSAQSSAAVGSEKGRKIADLRLQTGDVSGFRSLRFQEKRAEQG